MHWSSRLERRFIPPNAMIVADLRCVACGYPLRGLEARGRCPECGRPVLDAIRPIPEPVALAKALGEAGWAFLTLLLVVIASVFFGAITAGIGVMLLAVLAALRLFASLALRRILRAVPNHACNAAANRLLAAVAIEGGPIALLLVLTITHVAMTPPGWMSTVMSATPLMLLAVALAQVAALADLSRRMALWLELERMEAESKLALGLLAGGAVGLALSAVAGVGLTQARDLMGLVSVAAIVASIVLASRSAWRAAAAIPRLDQSPESLIDRPLATPAELIEHGLLPPPPRRSSGGGPPA